MLQFNKTSALHKEITGHSKKYRYNI